MLSPLLIGDVLSTASTAHYYLEISSSDMAERIYLDTCTLIASLMIARSFVSVRKPRLSCMLCNL